jgi:thioredoxin-dependent peroxiredoxin
MKANRLALAFTVLFSYTTLALAPGDKAPDFSAKNQDGRTIKLADFHGKYILVYFYPKDDTPGCTQEAKNFQSELPALQDLNTVVLGVSTQDQGSHQQFISKYKLQFDLLVDTDGALRKSFGIGSIPVFGLNKRQSVLIDPLGKVVRVYNNVDPQKHAAEVIADIRKMRGL